MTEFIDRLAGAMVSQFSELPPITQDLWRRKVRAMLAAARDPTREMLDRADGRSDPLTVWEAMVDEALGVVGAVI